MDSQDALHDIAIVGAGPVGLALAGWLLRESDWRIALVDARERGAALADARTLALAQGSQQLLAELGAWDALQSGAAFPIHTIHVSQRGGFGRTLMHREDYGVDALGYVARYGAVVQALEEALDAAAAKAPGRLSVLRPAKVLALRETEANTKAANANTGHAALAIEGRPDLHARLIVNAEGGLFNETAKKLGKADDARERDYGQTALLSTVSCTAPLPHWAWERFTDEGPLALLPLSPQRFALVWVGGPQTCERRLKLDAAAFLAELGQAFGARMGAFTEAGPRVAFPLGLRAAQTTVAGRMVAIGNAAQTLHPVAGQGLNLGLRDAKQLALALRDGLGEAALCAYARSRRLDRGFTIGLTDLLPRLFSNDFAPLGHARGLGLAALDLIPPLRHALARRLMTGSRRQP
ncbi:MAG: UbiH/UbiF/VisC/COQ6 family ubiquinone biosynthesis hydroxylase [Candidatus Protistobacter heckmanni]|nr:UbiH/UbiF/VisC/COQ6 family ubiquinone biosynthesis hydroxylase [Candidatus Protistobacter heckmanni]